jgi:hypothetical protein
MEVQVRGCFIGAVRRDLPAKGDKPARSYADLHASVAMRQGPGAVGQDVRSFRMEPALFDKLRSVPQFSPVLILCDESEYSREGGTAETVKVVVDVVLEAVPGRKAA